MFAKLNRIMEYGSIELSGANTQNATANKGDIEFLFNNVNEGTSAAGGKNISKAAQKLGDSVYSKFPEESIEWLRAGTNELNMNYEVFKTEGAHQVTGPALSALNKANLLIKNASAKIEGLVGEINRIQNSYLDEETIEKKVAELEEQINVIMEETSTKIDILRDVSNSLFKMHKIMLEMEIFNVNPADITDFMNNIISGMSTETTDISELADEEKLDEEVISKKMQETMENSFGENTLENFTEKKVKLQQKIVDLAEILANNDPEKENHLDNKEIEAINTQIKACNFEIKLLKNIENYIKDYISEGQQ